jgi:hypothetical protein
MRTFTGLVGIVLLLATPMALAGDCTPPGSFHRTNAIRGDLALVPGAGASCDIEATVAPGNDHYGGAFAWYTLPAPVSPWRISFRIDLSEMGVLEDFADTFHFLSVGTRHPYPQVDGAATLLNALVFRIDEELYFGLLFACADAIGSMCSNAFPVNLSDGDLLRFEVATGAGDGHVRWWLNSDFTDPPTGSIENIDNAAWQGVETVALGLFEPTGVVAANGATLKIQDIESPDDTLFWGNFDP